MVGGRQREAILKRNAAEPVPSPEDAEEAKIKKIRRLKHETICSF